MPSELLQIGGGEGEFGDASLFVAQVMCPAPSKNLHHDEQETYFVGCCEVHPIVTFESVGINVSVYVAHRVVLHVGVDAVTCHETDEGNADGSCYGSKCYVPIERLVDGQVIFCEVRKSFFIEIHNESIF